MRLVSSDRVAQPALKETRWLMSNTDLGTSAPNYGVVDDSKGAFVEQNENQTSANRVLATHS